MRREKISHVVSNLAGQVLHTVLACTLSPKKQGTYIPQEKHIDGLQPELEELLGSPCSELCSR